MHRARLCRRAMVSCGTVYLPDCVVHGAGAADIRAAAEDIRTKPRPKRPAVTSRSIPQPTPSGLRSISKPLGIAMSRVRQTAAASTDSWFSRQQMASNPPVMTGTWVSAEPDSSHTPQEIQGLYFLKRHVPYFQMLSIFSTQYKPSNHNLIYKSSETYGPRADTYLMKFK